ncbi:hypothetical protein N9051_01175 [Akkermansiaceae bacterium]|nr:hypothetical protein [Akkermansiaceae bacterium]
MNLKSYLSGALALFPLLGQGQGLLSLSDNKTYLQVGPREFSYQGGSLGTSIADGSFTLAACSYFPFGSGSPLRISPNISCPLGTTGFVTAGDVDGDLIRDTNRYFSISQIQGALQVEPFQTDRIRMIAAPPSALSRPIGGTGWEDNSIVIWFDQINFPVRAFELTRYDTERNYLQNQLQLQFDEVVPGTYIFEAPLLNDLQREFIFRITHLPMVEAWPGRGRFPGLNEFTLLNDELWSNGVIEIDPRVFNRFDWRGFNGNTVLLGDTTTFSMVARNNPIIRPSFDPLTLEVIDAEIPVGSVVFPPYDPAVAEGDRVAERIATPSSNYEIGAYFFFPGEEVTAVLNFNRSSYSTGNSIDASNRQFQWNIRFVQTFEGEIVSLLEEGILPGSTPDKYIGATNDYDGDGFTNIEEFGLQTDLTNPADVPVVTPVLDPFTNQCVLTLTKTPLVGNRLTYEVQYSNDLVTWTTISPSDPDWFVELNNEEVYQVRSRQPAPPSTCLLRVQITAN